MYLYVLSPVTRLMPIWMRPLSVPATDEEIVDGANWKCSLEMLYAVLSSNMWLMDNFLQTYSVRKLIICIEMHALACAICLTHYFCSTCLSFRHPAELSQIIYVVFVYVPFRLLDNDIQFRTKTRPINWIVYWVLYVKILSTINTSFTHTHTHTVSSSSRHTHKTNMNVKWMNDSNLPSAIHQCNQLFYYLSNFN